MVGAVIAAAGKSQRMGGVDKILALLDGKPVLARAIDVFQECPLIRQIVVALSESNLKIVQPMLARQGWTKVSLYAGGSRRQDSVAAVLKQLKQCDWVVIHDGARPLITEDLIERGLEAARETGAAVTAVPATDTIKVADEHGFVRKTLARQHLWTVQTPQVFRFDIIAEAYRQTQDEVTDDAALVEQTGHRVKLYMGSYDNIKVTTPDDLVLAELLWQKRQRRNR